MNVSRPSLWPILALFALEAVVTGLLIARFPDIKSDNGLSDAAFGLILFGIPTGTVIGFLLAPRSIRMVGLTRVSWIAALLLCLASIGPAVATNGPALLIAFLVYGFCLSHTEVTQNAMAGHFERTSGRRVMSRSHGAWSIGSIIGLLIGGAMSEAEISVLSQNAPAALVGTVAALMLARALPYMPGRMKAAAGPRLSLRGRLPPLALVLVCLLPLGTLAVEGIVQDWGAIFLRDVLGAQPFASTLLFVVLSASMVVVRLSGDTALERLGERTVVTASILCASVGLLVIALAPTLYIALLGAAVTGLGVAVVYPVALSIAARRSDTPERDVATVSFICFVALMASPTIAGVLSEFFGLRTTFIAFALASFLALLLLPTTRRRSKE